jgi:hypothetical protein
VLITYRRSSGIASDHVLAFRIIGSSPRYALPSRYEDLNTLIVYYLRVRREEDVYPAPHVAV